MMYQLITEVLNAIETVRLYEDMVGRDLDSDWEDDDYNPAFDPCIPFETDDDMNNYCFMSAPMSPQPVYNFGYHSTPMSPCEMAYGNTCNQFEPCYNMCNPTDITFDTVPDMNLICEPFCEHTVDTNNYMIMDGPCCAPISFPFGSSNGNACLNNYSNNCNQSGPSTEPLRKCFYRQPNDKFHETDPYMYYEATDHPNDEEYFAALFTLTQADEAICNDDDFERLRFEPFHLYVMAKRDNIDTRLSRKQWKVITDFFQSAERLQASVLTEIDRIEDLQWHRDDW